MPRIHAQQLAVPCDGIAQYKTRANQLRNFQGPIPLEQLPLYRV